MSVSSCVLLVFSPHPLILHRIPETQLLPLLQRKATRCWKENWQELTMLWQCQFLKKLPYGESNVVIDRTFHWEYSLWKDKAGRKYLERPYSFGLALEKNPLFIQYLWTDQLDYQPGELKFISRSNETTIVLEFCMYKTCVCERESQALMLF